MSILRRLRRRLGREDGTVSVETVLILPLLLGVVATSAVLWDGFSARNRAVKASYTVADAFSRTQGTITAAELGEMNALLAFLASSRGSTSMRVSVVRMGVAGDGTTPELQLVWSRGAGDRAPVTDVEQIAQSVPAMAVGDQVVLTETFLDWTPLIDVGLPAWTLNEAIATRPRFVPQVLWSG